VTRSSAEAEYRAMASTVSELIWIKQLLASMKTFCNNQAARYIASNPVLHERTKHVEADCHFVREKNQSKKIKNPYVKSEDQLAGVFTK
jgi:hypothetical protein